MVCLYNVWYTKFPLLYTTVNDYESQYPQQTSASKLLTLGSQRRGRGAGGARAGRRRGPASATCNNFKLLSQLTFIGQPFKVELNCRMQAMFYMNTLLFDVWRNIGLNLLQVFLFARSSHKVEERSNFAYSLIRYCLHTSNKLSEKLFHYPHIRKNPFIRRDTCVCVVKLYLSVKQNYHELKLNSTILIQREQNSKQRAIKSKLPSVHQMSKLEHTR